MDILKKFLNNPGFEHLAENIIGFLDIDKAMEIMIESQELSEDERKIFKKTLNRLMFNEAQEICEMVTMTNLHFMSCFPSGKLI